MRNKRIPTQRGTAKYVRPDEKSSGLFIFPADEATMEKLTNEELYNLCMNGDHLDDALAQLIKNLTPMMIRIGSKHLASIHLYETEDYIQEGSITLWDLIEKSRYNGKCKISTLFYSAFERRCTNLYRNYVLKNLIQVGPVAQDLYSYGYNLCTLVEADYAIAYRIKHREQCKKSYEKQKMARLAAQAAQA